MIRNGSKVCTDEALWVLNDGTALEFSKCWHEGCITVMYTCLCAYSTDSTAEHILLIEAALRLFTSGG
jgi:hypothetical protein